MAKTPSAYHNNRQHHNWLAYNQGDKSLVGNAPLYRGAMYDLGCGEAPYRDFFLQFAESYTGVDWSNTLHNSKADIVADLNKPLPINTGVADTVISLSVLEHLSEPQVMLNEAFRILKPGGTLILQVPWQWWIHEAPYDFFRYTPYGLEHMLKKAGFSDITVTAQSGFFSMWFLKFNYFSRRFVRGPKWLHFLILCVLVPVWYVNQWLAPYLDKLDRNWIAESAGYQAIAIKKVV